MSDKNEGALPHEKLPEKGSIPPFHFTVFDMDEIAQRRIAENPKTSSKELIKLLEKTENRKIIQKIFGHPNATQKIKEAADAKYSRLFGEDSV
jgi:hypothetical protein